MTKGTRKMRLLTTKQRHKLIANAKIRKQSKARLLQKLNMGQWNNGAGKASGHMLKSDIHESKQPSRYRVG
jgi:hypothetical protein